MRLNEYLDQNSMNQSAFAKRVGVTAEAVSQWISGVRSPRPKNILQIERETNGAVSFHDWHQNDNAAPITQGAVHE